MEDGATSPESGQSQHPTEEQNSALSMVIRFIVKVSSRLEFKFYQLLVGAPGRMVVQCSIEQLLHFFGPLFSYLIQPCRIRCVQQRVCETRLPIWKQ
jgi:hypothetical protein